MSGSGHGKGRQEVSRDLGTAGSFVQEYPQCEGFVNKSWRVPYQTLRLSPDDDRVGVDKALTTVVQL